MKRMKRSSHHNWEEDGCGLDRFHDPEHCKTAELKKNLHFKPFKIINIDFCTFALLRYYLSLHLYITCFLNWDASVKK